MLLNSNRRDWGVENKTQRCDSENWIRLGYHWGCWNFFCLYRCANRLEVPKGQEDMRWLLRSPYVCTVVLVWVPWNTDPETRMWVQVVHLGEGPKKHADGLGKWARAGKKTNQEWTQQKVTFVGILGTIALGNLWETVWSRIVLPNEKGSWAINSYLLFIEVHYYSKSPVAIYLGKRALENENMQIFQGLFVYTLTLEIQTSIMGPLLEWEAHGGQITNSGDSFGSMNLPTSHFSGPWMSNWN